MYCPPEWIIEIEPKCKESGDDFEEECGGNCIRDMREDGKPRRLALGWRAGIIKESMRKIREDTSTVYRNLYGRLALGYKPRKPVITYEADN